MGDIIKKLKSSADRNQSRIIWGFDPNYGFNNPLLLGKKILSTIHDKIAGVKINRQLILPLGLKNEGFISFINEIHDFDLPIIMDAKINDIGNTNISIASNYLDAGFDALITNPFIGWEDGLEPVFQIAKQKNRDIILLVYMSHTGSEFGYGRLVKDDVYGSISFYELFAKKISDWDAAGGIVGATFPDKIKKIRSIIPKDKLILSPGVGAQKGNYKLSRISGSDFIIIAREINNDKEPLKVVEKYNRLERELKAKG